MLNIEDPAKPETLPGLLRLGFRPFFLAGAVLAALALPVWLMTFYFPQYNWLPVLPLWWHPHELIFGFAMAIVAGFLLTAVQTWTSQPGMKGAALAVTFGCWLMARLLLLLPVGVPLWIPAIFDLLFLLLTAGKLWQSIYAVRQKRNIAFPILMTLVAAANMLSYWSLAKADFALSSRIWEGMIWWLTLVISLVGGRVIPFFTSRRLDIEKPEPIPWLDWSVFVLLLVLFFDAIGELLPGTVERSVLLVAGGLQLVRQLRWSPHKTFGEPLLWSLQLSYLCIPLALISMAIWHGDAFYWRQLLHVLAVGSIGGLCLSMMARVSLGHTGRNIYAGPAMAPAFAMVLLAAVLRGIFPLLFPAHLALWHLLSGLGWTMGFALFVWHYAAILRQPRVDGRPG